MCEHKHHLISFKCSLQVDMHWHKISIGLFRSVFLPQSIRGINSMSVGQFSSSFCPAMTHLKISWLVVCMRVAYPHRFPSLYKSLPTLIYEHVDARAHASCSGVCLKLMLFHWLFFCLCYLSTLVHKSFLFPHNLRENSTFLVRVPFC
jgi:hypothetical protein